MTKHILAFVAAFAALTSFASADDLCSHLTPAEASKFLGGPAAKNDVHADRCDYLSGRKELGYAVASGADGDALFDSAKQGGKAVSGLGGPAYFQQAMLVVKRGSKVLMVTLATSQNDVSKMNPKLPALAKLLLGRI